MKPIARFAFALACLVTLVAQAESDLRLWYTKPADVSRQKEETQHGQGWHEALPIGSGRLGAMVFGGVPEERIQFNEDTLWTGKPRDYVRQGAGEHLKEIQALVASGDDAKVFEAQKIFKDKMISDPIRQKSYQPFGDLRLVFAGHSSVSDYQRELDLTTAIATTRYKAGDVTYTREVFASYPDNAIIVHISADQPGRISFSVTIDSPHKGAQTTNLDDLWLDGKVTDPKSPESEGLRFHAQLLVQNKGGTKQTVMPNVVVTNADEVTLKLVAATNFVNFQDVSGNELKRGNEYMEKIRGKSYADLRKAHLDDFQKLFGRVSLDLGRNELANHPTDVRVAAFRKAANPAGTARKDSPLPDDFDKTQVVDSQLVALFFQYGRYMLITSSRPHTQAANLQGVWNELIDPPWESKYTTNINLQMNYWPTEVTNLSECHEPLFDMIDDLRISGARTAKSMYNARGWVLHHNTDLWRGTAPINNVDGMWTTGGAWLCHHLWEHYQFTGDKDFLARRAYPAMKEACEFFLDFLTVDPKTGYLVTNPSHSPEQTPPKRNNKDVPLFVQAAAMDMQLIRALFDSTIQSSKILGIDADFATKLAETRKKLVPDQVGSQGQLQEWMQDWDLANNNHRHMSPLWGLYPGSQFTASGDAKIWAGAKRLLQWRGDGSTGWSYAWRIPLWARVGDGDFAYRQLNGLLGKRVLPNLFDLCGPFQADGNYGATAGIAEMLLQSHEPSSAGVTNNGVKEGEQSYIITLLPALPKAWPNGRVSGLRARGGYEVSITWRDGKLVEASFTSLLGNALHVRYGDKEIAGMGLAKGKTGKVVLQDGQLKPR